MSPNLVWALIIVSIILLTISLFPQLMWATGSFDVNQDVARYVFLGLSLAGLLGLWLLTKSTSVPAPKPDIQIGTPILKKVMPYIEPIDQKEPVRNPSVGTYVTLPKSEEQSSQEPQMYSPTNLPPLPPPIAV